MTPEKVLAHAPKILDQSDREYFFEAGYLLKERFVSGDWLARLWEVTDRMVDGKPGFECIERKIRFGAVAHSGSPKIAPPHPAGRP